MPSSSVPETLSRGWPRLSVASMWKCGSTKGGETIGRGVDHLRRLGLELRRHLDDATVLDGDVDRTRSIGQTRRAEQQVEHSPSPVSF
jgi:hypothetical protein